MAETLDLCYKSFNDTFELISQKLEFYKSIVNRKTNKICAALDQLRVKYEKLLIIQLKKYIYYFKFEFAINQAQSGNGIYISISCVRYIDHVAYLIVFAPNILLHLVYSQYITIYIYILLYN